jgi:transcription initiation factor IIE alpha subunit
VDGLWLKRGELVTTQKALAERVSLTIKQVRLALAALKKAGVITTRTSRVNTIVSICNFDSYMV